MCHCWLVYTSECVWLRPRAENVNLCQRIGCSGRTLYCMMMRPVNVDLFGNSWERSRVPMFWQQQEREWTRTRHTELRNVHYKYAKLNIPCHSSYFPFFYDTAVRCALSLPPSNDHVSCTQTHATHCRRCCCCCCYSEHCVTRVHWCMCH